jgi:hypothetical protein
MPKMFDHCKITSDDAELYETDGADGITFPMKPARVAVSGNEVAISLVVEGKRDKRIDRLTEATITSKEPDVAPITITGTSEYLINTIGMDPSESQVTFVIDEFVTQHFDNQL